MTKVLHGLRRRPAVPGATARADGATSRRLRTSPRAEWFQDARFGLFVHWGVYSVLGDGEWVMQNKKIPIADYEKAAGAVQSHGIQRRRVGRARARPRA